MSRLTVAICTHSPDRAFLGECLDALRAQTLPPGEWDLLVIDNASQPALRTWLDLTWHPSARIIEEPALGIVHARLRAMREWTRGELLLFLDDDNIPAADYLATGLALSQAEPRLGCWGGQLIGRFAVPPPEWIGPFLKYLAVFPLERELRALSFTGNFDVLPPTAGMFLRRSVAEHYLRSVAAHPERLLLGGKRGAPIGGEDMDLGLAALELGVEVARFPQLVITHLIPAGRLTEDYVARLLGGIRTGTLLLEAIHGKPSSARSRRGWWFDQLRALRLPRRERRFFQAELSGELVARRLRKSFMTVK